MANKSLSVVVPCYNEERSISKTLDDLKKALKGITHEIIAVNDGSKDKTLQILKKRKDVVVISREENRGYGYSLKQGIRKAKYDWICITDADGTYPIQDIPKLASYDYDMVIGARTGEKVRIPFLRKPAKWFLKQLAQWLTQTRIPDLNSGLRIFRKEIALRFMSLFPDGFSFTTTITMASLTNNYSVKFIPINYYKREGKSSISAIRDFTGFTQLILKLVLYFKPLSIFLPASAALFVLGIIKLIIDFTGQGHFGLGGTIVVLTAIQLAFLGLLADMIIKRTRL